MFFIFAGYSGGGGRRDSLDRNSTAFSPSLMDQFNKNKAAAAAAQQPGAPNWPNAYGNLGSLAAGQFQSSTAMEEIPLTLSTGTVVPVLVWISFDYAWQMPKLPKIVIAFKFHQSHAEISPTGKAIPVDKDKEITTNK